LPDRVLDDLQLILDLSFWWISPTSRSVINRLLASRGRFISADALGRSVGLRNRHQLAHVLRRDGLLPPSAMTAWARLTVWTAEWESNGRSLCALTLDEDRDPASSYRLVQSLTGSSWLEVRQRGVIWVIECWLEECCRPLVESGEAHNRLRDYVAETG
jgi:hypothetical protein